MLKVKLVRTKIEKLEAKLEKVLNKIETDGYTIKDIRFSTYGLIGNCIIVYEEKH